MAAAVFAAHFWCLAETTTAEEFALIADQAITDFAGRDHRRFLSELCAPPLQGDGTSLRPPYALRRRAHPARQYSVRIILAEGCDRQEVRR
jgi:hypothetical protein